MSYTAAVDCSQWQGTIAWPLVNVPIAIIKMSGGDNGLYTDSKANANYYGAKSSGKAIGGYHFAGGKDAVNEADFFISCMSPLEQDDVMVLDFEIPHADPVGWCRAFVNRVHDRTGVWPLLYINLATLNAHDWSSVLNNCGLWLAAWNNDPEATLTNHPYVMHQYSSNGTVPGIGGRVDLDAWFGS
jgi:lysozyme